MIKKKFPKDLFDKNGQKIYEDDIISNGEHYFRIYWNRKQPQVEAISPTYGYLHDLTQTNLILFERIGSFNEYEYLTQVD